jgi:hypothetical protein
VRKYFVLMVSADSAMFDQLIQHSKYEGLNPAVGEIRRKYLKDILFSAIP